MTTKQTHTDNRVFEDIKHAEQEANKIQTKAAQDAQTIIEEAKTKAAQLVTQGIQTLEQEAAQNALDTKHKAQQEAETTMAQTKETIKKIKTKSQKKAALAQKLIVEKFRTLC